MINNRLVYIRRRILDQSDVIIDSRIFIIYDYKHVAHEIVVSYENQNVKNALLFRLSGTQIGRVLFRKRYSIFRA